jgi:hypothetical protein
LRLGEKWNDIYSLYALAEPTGKIVTTGLLPQDEASDVDADCDVFTVPDAPSGADIENRFNDSPEEMREFALAFPVSSVDEIQKLENTCKFFRLVSNSPGNKIPSGPNEITDLLFYERREAPYLFGERAQIVEGILTDYLLNINPATVQYLPEKIYRKVPINDEFGGFIPGIHSIDAEELEENFFNTFAIDYLHAMNRVFSNQDGGAFLVRQVEGERLGAVLRDTPLSNDLSLPGEAGQDAEAGTIELEGVGPQVRSVASGAPGNDGEKPGFPLLISNLLGAQLWARNSNSNTVQNPVYQSIFSREYLVSNDNLIAIIGSKVNTPSELPALRANLINEAAFSIGWHAGYLKNSNAPNAAEIDRLNRQAVALIGWAAEHADELYYGLNIRALKSMTTEVCGMSEALDCTPVNDAMSALMELLPSQAKEGAPATNWLVDSMGVALSGHDPVKITNELSLGENDFFGLTIGTIEGGSTGFSPRYLGRERLSYRWPKGEGPLWLFTSRENLEAFKAAPSRYAPQIGGYDLGALLSDKPALVPLSDFSILQIRGEFFFYNSGYDIDFERLDKKALDFAKDAYRKLTDPRFKGSVEAYKGELPKLTIF